MPSRCGRWKSSDRIINLWSATIPHTSRRCATAGMFRACSLRYQQDNKVQGICMKKLFFTAAAAAIGLAIAVAPAAAQTLEKIKQRGTLIVGSKADYKPFGFRDPSGAIVGFEPDIAKLVADRLGVNLEIEPVVSSDPLQVLQQGKIDLMTATMNDKPDRRLLVGIIEPLYYASGVNVLGNKKASLKNWEQLKDQKVCGIQGAWYNKPVAEKYGADIVAFKGQTEAEVALQQGNCIGWVYDDTAVAERLAH